jgi:hypothetical protein
MRKDWRTEQVLDMLHEEEEAEEADGYNEKLLWKGKRRRHEDGERMKRKRGMKEKKKRKMVME